MEDFFDKVLIPIMKELEDKNFNDVDKDVMDKITKIYNENFFLIPPTMISKHNDLKKQFETHKLVDKKYYKSYLKYLKLTFKNTRKRLGYPKDNKIIYFRSLSIPQKSFVCVITIMYLITGVILINKGNDVGLAIAVIIYCILVLLFVATDELFTRKRIIEQKNKSDSQKSNDTTSEEVEQQTQY